MVQHSFIFHFVFQEIFLNEFLLLSQNMRSLFLLAIALFAGVAAATLTEVPGTAPLVAPGLFLTRLVCPLSMSQQCFFFWNNKAFHRPPRGPTLRPAPPCSCSKVPTSATTALVPSSLLQPHGWFAQAPSTIYAQNKSIANPLLPLVVAWFTNVGRPQNALPSGSCPEFAS